MALSRRAVGVGQQSVAAFLGWFVVSPHDLPPVSLLIFYWMIGAFFMASKRFAEYRMIGDKASTGSYRGSFKFYDEHRLLISVFYYATAAALLLGVFVVHFKLELLLSVPLIAGSFSYYLKVALKPDSKPRRSGSIANGD